MTEAEQIAALEANVKMLTSKLEKPAIHVTVRIHPPQQFMPTPSPVFTVKNVGFLPLIEFKIAIGGASLSEVSNETERLKEVTCYPMMPGETRKFSLAEYHQIRTSQRATLVITTENGLRYEKAIDEIPKTKP